MPGDTQAQGDIRANASLADEPPLSWVPLLGADRATQVRVSQNLLASGLMLPYLFAVWWAGTRWPVPVAPLVAWVAVCMVLLVLSYIALRSGWSMQFKDPSLTQVQMVASLALVAASYGLVGPLRGMVPSVMLIVLCFGMFRLRVGRAMQMGALAWLMLAVAVSVQVWVWPKPSDPAIDFGILCTAIVMFPAIGVLAGRLSRIRLRLTEQRQQLNTALARIEELATRDPLTGLFNRRHADSLLRQALRRHLRSSAPFSLAMIDLDHFKRINDTHGHAVGDQVLCAFAQAAQSTLRATDTLARWGGEEFLLLLDDTQPEMAMVALLRIQQAVAIKPVQVDGQAVWFTFSAGLVRMA